MASNDNNRRLTFSEKTLSQFLEKILGKHYEQVTAVYDRVERLLLSVDRFSKEHKSVRFWVKWLTVFVGIKIALFFIHLIIMH